MSYQSIPPGGPFVQTLVATATDVAFPGLDGDGRGDIELSGYIVLPAAGTVTFTIQPNALTTNQVSRVMANNGAAVSAVGTSDIRIAGIAISGAGGYIMFWSRISAISGKPRHIAVEVMDFDGGSTRRQIINDCVWTPTTGNITSVVVHSDTADAFGIGSRLVVNYLGVKT